MANSNVKEVEERTVSCDGGGGELGHPKVYLEIKPNESSIICPYCSTEFVLKTKKNGNKT